MIYNTTLNIDFFFVLYYIYGTKQTYENMNLAETYKKVKPSIIALALMENINESQCHFHPKASGVCVDSSGIFITAKHCIDYNGTNLVEKFDFYGLTTPFVVDGKEFGINTFRLRESKIYCLRDWDIAVIVLFQNLHHVFHSINMPTNWNLNEGELVGCTISPKT
jgi:hypothetical protein